MIGGRAREACRRGLGLVAALLTALLIVSDHCASAQEVTKMVGIGVLASAEEHPIQSFSASYPPNLHPNPPPHAGEGTGGGWVHPVPQCAGERAKRTKAGEGSR
jgi:hypothetical protein